jgi:hypothetical protein
MARTKNRNRPPPGEERVAKVNRKQTKRKNITNENVENKQLQQKINNRPGPHKRNIIVPGNILYGEQAKQQKAEQQQQQQQKQGFKQGFKQGYKQGQQGFRQGPKQGGEAKATYTDRLAALLPSARKLRNAAFVQSMGVGAKAGGAFGLEDGKGPNKPLYANPCPWIKGTAAAADDAAPTLTEELHKFCEYVQVYIDGQLARCIYIDI